MGYVLIVYYLAELMGALLLMTRIMRCALPLPGAPGWMHLLLAVGAFPVLVTWGGFLRIFRLLPLLAPLLGFAFAAFGVRELVRHAPALAMQARTRIQAFGGWEWGLAAVAAVLLAAFLIPHYCYYDGGTNNTDDNVRGMQFTTAFAANWLKPAYPIDMSIPVSYGYYYYQWSAFFYASVNGYSWPSLPLVVAAFMAAALFYIILPQCIGEFIDRPYAEVALISVISVSVVGPDMFFNTDAVGRWPTEWRGLTYQLMQVANTVNWEYHYLVGTLFALAGLICLRRAMDGGPPNYLSACGVYICLAVTFATLTGVFYCCVIACTAAIFLAGGWLHWRSLLRAAPLTALFGFFILAPQVFTFTGRSGYFTAFLPATIWWTGTPILEAGWIDWMTLLGNMLVHIGPLLFVGLLALPFYLNRAVRGHPFQATVVAVMMVATFVSLSFVKPFSFDWYVRTGQACLLLLGTLGATWLFGQCRRHRLFRNAVVPIFVLLAFAGSGNFYMEERSATTFCRTPRAWVSQVNEAVDLHTAIASSELNPKGLTFAGRPVTFPNPLLRNILVYRGTPDFLKRWFGWHRSSNPCHESWFGTAIPGTSVARLRGDALHLMIDYASCAGGYISKPGNPAVRPSPRNPPSPF